ncbi:chromate transporter [Lentisphaerae bacterium WC36]|nr:chromate transporter [Lentisphaerae bacterium WC36]
MKLWSLFATCFRISLFTVGGGYAMLPIMEHEFVEKKKWIDHEDIVDVIAIVQSVPGIIAVNTSVFVGSRVAGFWGAITASLGMVLPSFVIILLIAIFTDNLQDNEALKNVFLGVRAGVCATIFLSALNLWQKVVKTRFEIVIAILGFLALNFFREQIILIIVVMAIVGIIRYKINALKMTKVAENSEKDCE